MLIDQLDELAEAIVLGERRHAYRILRDHFPDQPTFDVRLRHAEAMRTASREPAPSHDEIIAAHDRVLARQREQEAERKAIQAAAGERTRKIA